MNAIISELIRSSDYFYEDAAAQNEVKVRLISEAFSYHRSRNKHYKGVCDEAGAAGLEIKTVEDIGKIPLLNIQEFKQADSSKLLTSRLSEIEFEMRSTGTTGVPSISRRDYESCNNAFAYIMGLYRDFFHIANGVGLYFSTSLEEMPEMGMVKALNFMNATLDTADFLVRGVTFDNERAIADLKKWEGKFTRHILGAPFLLSMFVDYLKLKDVRLTLDKSSKIITMGGWKRYSGIQIPREELAEKCHEYLGVDAGQIRDMYGLVECNTLAIECENNIKHIPATTHMSIRNMENPEIEEKDGNHGLVAIYDPSSHSYPAFILTEDIGVIERGKACECGRLSDTIRIVGRAPKAETGCCAIRLDRQMNEGEEA
ncbi:MAG: hypothetical protein LBC41_16045 [Clostridiales bacterium]|nr:hypothetical protein [Clostridiales bacterium]MDR2752168.1 hypothetical protein [Clostridiales bacterium]